MERKGIKSITVAAIRQQPRSKLPKGAITTTTTGEGNLADCDIQAVTITSQRQSEVIIHQRHHSQQIQQEQQQQQQQNLEITASTTNNNNSLQHSTHSSVDRAMQRCGLCSILSRFLRRAMCIGSRRGSGESYYQELAETNVSK